MKRKIIAILLFTNVALCHAQDPHFDEEPYADLPSPSRSDKNLNLVKAIYAAFAKGEMAVVLDLLHDEVVWNEAESFPYADGNPYVGKDAVLSGVFARIGADWEYFTLSDLSYHAMYDDMVLATGYYNTKHKQTGKTVKVQMGHLWWIDDGKLTRFQQYADTKKVADALKM